MGPAARVCVRRNKRSSLAPLLPPQGLCGAGRATETTSHSGRARRCPRRCRLRGCRCRRRCRPPSRGDLVRRLRLPLRPLGRLRRRCRHRRSRSAPGLPLRRLLCRQTVTRHGGGRAAAGPAADVAWSGMARWLMARCLIGRRPQQARLYFSPKFVVAWARVTRAAPPALLLAALRRPVEPAPNPRAVSGKELVRIGWTQVFQAPGAPGRQSRRRSESDRDSESESESECPIRTQDPPGKTGVQSL